MPVLPQTVCNPFLMAEIPFEADHSVVRAEMETSDIPGRSRSSVRISVNALRMGSGIKPCSYSVMVERSVGVTRPMMAARRDRNGTAEMMTKKDAWAA